MTSPTIHYETREELDEVVWTDCTARLERTGEARFRLTLTRGDRKLIVKLAAEYGGQRLEAWIEEEPEDTTTKENN